MPLFPGFAVSALVLGGNEVVTHSTAILRDFSEFYDFREDLGAGPQTPAEGRLRPPDPLQKILMASFYFVAPAFSER